MKQSILLVTGMFGALASASATEGKGVLVDRVADTGFLEVRVESFSSLDARQKELAYWLTQAAIAIDPIVYDQLSSYGLREKRLLEEIMAHASGLNAEEKAGITSYAELFWANRGNHNLTTSQKFIPSVPKIVFQHAAMEAFRHGAFRTASGEIPSLKTEAQVEEEVNALDQAIFDLQFEPMITAKSPSGGKDIIEASSNTFYSGVALTDLNGFHGKYSLNSRIVKGPGGTLTEIVDRAGTPDGKVAPGLYATYLGRAIEFLARAKAVAEPGQAEVIGHLIRYYQTGEYSDWLAFGTAWVQDNSKVDFENGFVEVYRDANSMKGSSQAFVSVTDEALSRTMTRLAANAAYFEEKAPWLDAYKKKDFRPPVIKAIETVVETGDYEVSVVGDNLPNENEIHEKYGTKNFLLTSSSRAIREATGTKSAEEFDPSPEVLTRRKKYGDEASDLMTALHEVIGHGSGKLSDRLQKGSQSYLKEYYSTLEEGRADLMALWNAWDPKLKELGLVSNQQEVAKAMYDSAAMAPLTQLSTIPSGDTIEESHQRDRALISNYVRDTTGAIRQFDRDGKTYIQVTDYAKMREGVGRLLAEIMRIKAEGDFDAIKALVSKYAVHFDPALRDQVVARFNKLDIPTYWAGVYPELKASFNADGSVRRIAMERSRDPVKQYLQFASMFDPDLASP